MTDPVRCCYEPQALQTPTGAPGDAAPVPHPPGREHQYLQAVPMAEGKGAVPSRTGPWSVREQLWGTTELWALPEQLRANTWHSEHACL